MRFCSQFAKVYTHQSFSLYGTLLPKVRVSTKFLINPLILAIDSRLIEELKTNISVTKQS